MTYITDTGILTKSVKLILNKLKDSGELTKTQFDKIRANMNTIRME